MNIFLFQNYFSGLNLCTTNAKHTSIKRIAMTLTFFSLLLNNQTTEEHGFAIRAISIDGQVSQEVLRLLELTNVTHDGTVADIVAKTQVAWLRKPGTERWDIEDSMHPSATEIYKIMHKLWLINDVFPPLLSYEYAVIPGGLLSRIILRTQYLVNLWEKGVRFKKIILIAGARPVAPEQGENVEALQEFAGEPVTIAPQTEADLITFVYKHIKMPKKMRKIPMELIDVPMLPKTDGSLRRPTRGDTIEWWLKTNPTPSSILVASNQPFVWYDQSVFETFMPKEFHVHVVGVAATSPQNIGVLLDNLARILYQEKQRLKL